jgi:glutamate--cysteine ligase
MSPRQPSLKTLLARQIRAKRKELGEWHREHARLAPPPFYCSVDLRDSGHKIVPVDSNLFPAGFNNICPEDIRAAKPVLKSQLDRIAEQLGAGSFKRVLIVPESHTSNTYYIENLYYLTQIITDAGFEVRLGWHGALPEGHDAGQPIRLVSATEKQLEAWPLEIKDGAASAGGFTPEVILLNNDFSSGYPAELDAVAQPIFPSHVLGWHSRKKSEHFVHYNRLAAEFAAIVGIDPWAIQVDTEAVGPVNFDEDQGVDDVAQVVDRVLARTQSAYDRHGVKQTPFAFVKNNAGTYGMGIMVVHSADELRTMNRRTKHKMSVGKNRLPIESVVVQEGIPTATLVDRLAAEPVIYLMGCELIGGFLRTNTQKGTEDNLNSQGMVFKKLCMSDLRALDDDAEDGEPVVSGDTSKLELVYGSIARISALALGIELAEHIRERAAKNASFKGATLAQPCA